jgi:hypothetical protein
MSIPMNIKDALKIVEEKGNSFVYNCVIDDLVETLAAELRRLTTMKPMNEAPEDGTKVNVYYKDETGYKNPLPPFWAVASYHENAGWCGCQIRIETGWLPLINPEDYKNA